MPIDLLFAQCSPSIGDDLEQKPERLGTETSHLGPFKAFKDRFDELASPRRQIGGPKRTFRADWSDDNKRNVNVSVY